MAYIIKVSPKLSDCEYVRKDEDIRRLGLNGGVVFCKKCNATRFKFKYQATEYAKIAKRYINRYTYKIEEVR